MRLWFRLLWFFITSPFRSKIASPLDKSIMRFRVHLTDIDTNIHLNNGQYLTLMDLGRMDVLLRTGLWRPVLKNKWMPVVSSASIRFRREIGLFQPFLLETRIVYWEEGTGVMEQRFRLLKGKHKGVIAATSLVRVGMYNKKAREFVAINDWMEQANLTSAVPPLEPHVKAFLEAEEQLKRFDRKPEA
ncbi:acyl-CoA thioesterase [Polycladidibacter stylochi]|uniref:acyl-CoA thioesterase n=1 Tax=Polycladidibacter stylochi TaxID=1807766 RepID=UPI000830486A|nr:thioesterase family protein [Pseudovibrio stylochi]